MSKQLAAWISIAGAALTLALLLALHVLSPEFSPAWRMVSEYGNGRYEWVLTSMFVVWGASMLSLAYALASNGRRVGLIALCLAGIGAVGGGVFDINHDAGHSIAGFLGILGLPLAALLLKSGPRWATHLPWITLVLFALSFAVMVASFLAVRGSLPSQVPQSVPAGVIAWVGWTNRLLVVAYCVWISAAALTVARPSGARRPQPGGHPDPGRVSSPRRLRA
ncbi:MAG TPA: DUF998 domain-containing protein [Candidatus Dormibacteraeota bacterium]